MSGMGSLVFGHLFDRLGMAILVPLTLISALFAPLVFLGHFWLALLGSAIWGLGMGVHESIVPAAVATMVPVQRRPSAYGLFTAGYGVFWFVGSALMGLFYDVSLSALIVFSVMTQIAAIPIFLRLEQVLGQHGLPRAPWQTPLEYLRAALLRFQLPEARLHGLTTLFELAKFSAHSLAESEKGLAIAVLREVKAALEEDSHVPAA